MFDVGKLVRPMYNYTKRILQMSGKNTTRLHVQCILWDVHIFAWIIKETRIKNKSCGSTPFPSDSLNSHDVTSSGLYELILNLRGGGWVGWLAL